MKRRNIGTTKKMRFGPTTQKILLLLSAGHSLAFERRGGNMFRMAKIVKREWKKINRRALYAAIRQLYQSKMVDYRESPEGIAEVVLLDEGKKKSLVYDMKTLTIATPPRWDEQWRIIFFDIPESQKKARDAFALKLKQIGFAAIQKSVFAYPYPCKDEIDVLVEILDIRPYVRFMVTKELDIALDLKDRFNLL